jgi:tetratricopeptide (TPR) repeat protein
VGSTEDSPDLEEAERAHAENPSDQTFIDLLTLYTHLGQFVKGRALASTWPASNEYQVLRPLLRLAVHSNDAASVESISAALSALGDECFVHEMLGSWFIGKEQWAEASSHYEQIPEAHMDERLRGLRAYAGFMAGDSSKANMLMSYASHDDAITQTLVMAAMIRRQQGHLEKAEELLDRALRNEPNSCQALFQLAIVREAQDRLDDATNLLNAALQINPTRTDALYGRASVALKRGDYVAGVADLEALLATNPDDEQALILLMRTLFRRRRYLAAWHVCGRLEDLRFRSKPKKNRGFGYLFRKPST